MGIADNRADWPYRYRITQTDGQWSGAVDLRVADGWVPWDTMQITEQKADWISFQALLGEPGKAIPLGWYLDLGDTSGQSFSARVTGDAFDSRAVELEFTRWNGEPDGPANGSQPIRSETKRTSSAAGSRR